MALHQGCAPALLAGQGTAGAAAIGVHFGNPEQTIVSARAGFSATARRHRRTGTQVLRSIPVIQRPELVQRPITMTRRIVPAAQ